MSKTAIVGLAAAVLFAGCKAPATFKVRETPLLDAAGERSILNSDRVSDRSERVLNRRAGRIDDIPVSADERLAYAESQVRTARRLQRKNPSGALGFYLLAAESSEGGEDALLRQIYNLSCAEVAYLAHRIRGDQWRLQAGGKTFELRLLTSGDRETISNFDTLIPTARVDQGDLEEVGGDIVQVGVGGALVGYVSKDRKADDPAVSSVGIAVPLAAVVEFHPEGVAELSVYDVGQQDDRLVGGRVRKLAADFAAPVSMVAARTEKGNLGFRAMVRPDKYKGEGGLFLMEPFQEDKIPLIFVHGLTSAPRTWRWTYTPLMRDEKLRENYQMWFYRYPTGYGLGETTATFRRHLRDTMARYNPDGKNAALNQTVLVGHSMGGVLSSAMIRSSGDKIWTQIFDLPPDELDVDEETRANLREVAIFEAQPYISRVVFIATPHRGSDLTQAFKGRLGEKLIKAPTKLLQLQRPGILEALTSPAQSWLGDGNTSIESLHPDSWRLKLLNSLPIREGVTYHSIIGDQVKGDTPNSNDGWVPYWSSHLEGAASEVIVPSGHSAQRHPEAHVELRRILHEHLDDVGR